MRCARWNGCRTPLSPCKHSSLGTSTDSSAAPHSTARRCCSPTWMPVACQCGACADDGVRKRSMARQRWTLSWEARQRTGCAVSCARSSCPAAAAAGCDRTRDINAHTRTRPRLQHCLHTRYTRRRAASLTAAPDALSKSRSMLHHACLLSAAPVHTSPLAPRTSGWRCSAASVASASARRGRSCAAAAASSALPAAAHAAREISSAKSGREQWAKGFVIEACDAM